MFVWDNDMCQVADMNVNVPDILITVTLKSMKAHTIASYKNATVYKRTSSYFNPIIAPI